MIKLIPNWKKSWKFSSMWYAGTGFLIATTDQILQVVPMAQLHAVPHGKTVMWVLFGLTILGRILKKKEVPNG